MGRDAVGPAGPFDDAPRPADRARACGPTAAEEADLADRARDGCRMPLVEMRLGIAGVTLLAVTLARRAGSRASVLGGIGVALGVAGAFFVTCSALG